MVERRAVLVVSDDPGRSAQVRLTLGDDRAEVRSVGHAAAGDALVGTTPDVVLLDLASEQPGAVAATLTLLAELTSPEGPVPAPAVIGLVAGEVDERLLAACSRTVRLPTTPFVLLRHIDEVLT